MTAREVLNTVLPAIGKTQADVAASIEWTPQQLSQKLTRCSLRTDEFLEIMEANGIEVMFKIKETGEVLEVKLNGHGRRLKGMSDRVKYDTAAAGALSNTFYADGENEYDEKGEAQELYVDTQGRYFIAEYHADDPSKDQITAIPASVAEAFIAKYGTTIEKK